MCAETGGHKCRLVVVSCILTSYSVFALAIDERPPVLLADASDQNDRVSQAKANDESQSIQEIVVTARKRSERVIDIPESITAISAGEIEGRGIQTVEDLGRQTPNLQLNMRQDLTTDVVIRGVGAYGDVLGVGFNIDNVPNFTDQTMRLEDLESVEILKGPQGTLYGGSSIGGLIRYVSKRPEFNWNGQSSVGWGSYNTYNVFAAQNAPLIDDKLALRVSAYIVKGDGYLTNSALGIYGSPLKDYGVRAALLYKPIEDFEALLTLRTSTIRNGGDEYSPIRSVTDFTYDVPLFQPTSNRRSTTGAVLELNGELDALKLTSISSYARSPTTQTVAISFTPPNVPGQSLYTTAGIRPTVVSTQEFRITSPSGRTFEWLVGLYGADIRNVLLNQNAVANYPPPPLLMVVNDFDTKRTDTAVFGTTSYHFGTLTLETGVRLTETKYRADIFIEAGGLPNQSAEITSRAALPKISLSHALPQGGQIYASVAKGEEPGAVNTVSTAPIPYDSEKSTSYEIGAKGEAPNRQFQYEVAAFYIKDINHQFQTNQYIASEGGLVTLTANIGDSRSYGVEASGTWHPLHGLSIGLSGGYLNAKWLTATVFGQPIDGNTIPNSPEVTGALNIHYIRALSSELQLDANFDMAYTDAMWWDLPNTPGSKMPPYWMGNTRLAVGPERGTWQLALRVSNILGAKYWTEYFPNFFPAGSDPCAGCNNIGAIGAPRQYNVSLEFKY
jgi:iron complex outermembrane recepter protein